MKSFEELDQLTIPLAPAKRPVYIPFDDVYVIETCEDDPEEESDEG